MQPSLTVTRESLDGDQSHHDLVSLPGSQQSSESDCLSQSEGWPEIDSNCFYVLKSGGWGWGALSGETHTGGIAICYGVGVTICM